MNLKQVVTLELFKDEEGGKPIFKTSGLRIDFDIRSIMHYTRGTITVYNLANDMVEVIMGGGLYATLTAQLHDGEEFVLGRRLVVNNATDELILPNRIVTLFCFDRLRQTFEQPLPKGGIRVFKPTLRNMMRALLGGVEPVYLSFPEGKIDSYVGERGSRTLQGDNIQSCLRKLGTEFNFETYTIDGNITLIYKPDEEEKALLETEEAESRAITLQTRAMRSNPRVSVATANIDSNLDGRIRPGSILILSELLTVAVTANEDVLNLAQNYLKNFRNNRFQAFSIQNVGSNFTSTWNTKVVGIAPTKGSLMNTVSWANVR